MGGRTSKCHRGIFIHSTKSGERGERLSGRELHWERGRKVEGEFGSKSRTGTLLSVQAPCFPVRQNANVGDFVSIVPFACHSGFLILVVSHAL